MQDYKSIITILFNNKSPLLNMKDEISNDGFIVAYYYCNNSVLQCSYFEQDNVYRVIYNKKVITFNNHKLFINHINECLSNYLKPILNYLQLLEPHCLFQ